MTINAVQCAQAAHSEQTAQQTAPQAAQSEQTDAIDAKASDGVDPRIMRSRDTLITAMTELLREQPIDKITASMVAREAHTSRPTLYQHFGDLTGLTVAAAVHNLEQLLFTAWEQDGPVAGNHRGGSTRRSADAIRNLLNHLQEDRDFFLNVTQGPSSYRVVQAITHALARQLWNALAYEEGLDAGNNPFATPAPLEEHHTDSNEPSLAQQLQFVSDGVAGAAIGWLTGTRDETVERLATTLQNLAQRVLWPQHRPGHATSIQTS